MSHTPGPWTIGGIFDPNGPAPTMNVWGKRPRGAQSGKVIAEHLSVADAHLVAAAPDLYVAACKVLSEFDAGAFVRNTDSDGCSDWAMKAATPLAALAALKTAIAKADGR